MTQMPGSVPPTQQKKGGVPVIVWVLGGCGCLTFGGFIVMILLAISLPSLINKAGKARASEAKSTN